MTVEQLGKIYPAEPFQPFLLHLADGRSLKVPHREFLSHSPTGRTVVVHGEEESWSVVDLLLVTRIEVNPAPTRGQNGKFDFNWPDLGNLL